MVSCNPFVKLFICCLFWLVSVLSPLGVNECSLWHHSTLLQKAQNEASVLGTLFYVPDVQG